MNTVDYIILGFMACMLLFGYFRGFVLTFFSFVGYVAAIICAKLFSPDIAAFIGEKTSLNVKIQEFVNDRLSSLSLPAGSGSISDFQIPENFESELAQNPELAGVLNQNPILKNLLSQADVSSIGQSLSDILSNFVLTILAVFLIFLAVKIIAGITGKIIHNAIKKSRTLNSANRLGGLALGALTGIVIVVLILTVTSSLVFTAGTGEISAAVNESIIARAFYESGLFIKLVESGLNPGI